MVFFGMHSPHASPCFANLSRRNSFLNRNQFSRSEKLHRAELRLLNDGVDEEGAMDSPEKKPERSICSFVVVYTMIFFNGCCFTAVAPSVPFYLQFLMAPPSFLGWVVSFYSLGQIFGSPLGGWLSSLLSTKSLLTISSVLGLFSSIAYAAAPGYYVVLFSRFFTGVSAGLEFSTELTFIAGATTMKERTAFLASVTACNVAGFIMGPALGIVISMLDLNILGLAIDECTGPGWLLTTMFLLDLMMVQLVFREHKPAQYKTSNEAPLSEQTPLLGKHLEKRDTYSGDTSIESLEDSSQDSTERSNQGVSFDTKHSEDTSKEAPPSLVLVLSLIFVQFSLMSGFSLLETITSPLVHDGFGWAVQDCNLLFTCGGIFSLSVYVAFVAMSKCVQDRYLVFTSLVLCSVGFLLTIDWHQLSWVPAWALVLLPPHLPCFLVGFALIYAGFMTGRSLVFALYSKLIAQEYQGEYLSWMVAGGSAARTLGPFAAVSLYYGIKGTGNNLLVLFGSVGLFHISCIVLVIFQWSKLLPLENNHSKIERLLKGRIHEQKRAAINILKRKATV